MGRPRTTDQQFVIRAPASMVEALKHFAARRGQPAAEVARTAIGIHLVESMIHALDNDEEFVAEMRRERPDVDLAEERGRAEQNLAELRAGAFKSRPAYEGMTRR